MLTLNRPTDLLLPANDGVHFSVPSELREVYALNQCRDREARESAEG